MLTTVTFDSYSGKKSGDDLDDSHAGSTYLLGYRNMVFLLKRQMQLVCGASESRRIFESGGQQQWRRRQMFPRKGAATAAGSTMQQQLWSSLAPSRASNHPVREMRERSRLDER